MTALAAIGNTTPVYTTATGEVYVRNEKALHEIVTFVHQGYYSTVLGPRYCQKGLLLRDVKAALEASSAGCCVLIDLQAFDVVADHEFLTSFATKFDQEVRAQQVVADPPVPAEVVDERSLQRFLQTYMTALARDVVLLINHLEYIRFGPLQSLLLALRAIYVERSLHDPYRLGVVTASSLIVAELSLGENSPFNIARLIWITDLSTDESNHLIEYILQRHRVALAAEGQQRLIQATHGDRNLIPLLCEYCAEMARDHPDRTITQRTVERAIARFQSEEADRYPPLRETVRALEDAPVNLLNVVAILRTGFSPRRQLNLALQGVVDDLQLTGAVRVENRGDEKVYFIRNEIYADYLRRHFHPERVVRVLSLARHWSQAITYLEELVGNEPAYRATLLGVFVDSIYAAHSKEEACADLSRVLTHAFAAASARIYLVTPTRAKLKRISHFGFVHEPAECIFFTQTDRDEIQTYLKRHYQVVNQPWGDQVVFFPLLSDDGQALGIAAVHGFAADPQRDEFLEMQTFLKQVSRAIGIVIDRERTLNQFEKLQKTGKRVTSSLDLQQVLQETVEAAIEAVPAAQCGILLLWQDKEQRLRVSAQKGYPDHIGEVAIFGRGEGYTGWVFAHREPLLLPSVFDDPRAKRFVDPTLNRPKSAISVPLEAWGRVIGVLNLENMATLNAFQQADLDLLYTFGTQAAIAIQNASLYTELYALGMAINRGQLTPEQIFAETVQSIMRVSDAKAANLLLLRDTDDPQTSITQSPLLSASVGLGDDYDQRIVPRLDGLTALVLTERKPHAVSSPGQSPGINSLAIARGIQANLCLPLMIHDAITGILFVHYDKPHSFSDNEIHMLSLFANQAALAIENNRQQEELTMTKAVAWTGIVFSSLAHRITQKGSAIRNAVWGLRRTLPDNASALERLERIDEYARSVQEIPSRALLPFHDTLETFDLNTLVRQEVARWCAEEPAIQPDFTGMMTEEVSVHADPRWIALVLEMLTTNALRALGESTCKALCVRSTRRRQRVVVEMTNGGAAIPLDIQKKLFKEPIAKAPGAEGSGVGLLLARTIMLRYKGDIELVQSSDAEGTTFAFWLPLCQAVNQ